MFTEDEKKFLLHLVKNEMQKYHMDSSDLGRQVQALGESILDALASGARDLGFQYLGKDVHGEVQIEILAGDGTIGSVFISKEMGEAIAEKFREAWPNFSSPKPKI